MDTLKASPFLLVFDDLVQVRVSATNSFGYGHTSTINVSGAKIRVIPDSPIPTRGSLTSISQI